MELTVPLVDRGNGLWGSSSPAWDRLINRESSGRPKVVQSPSVVDVNTGGNEAEGLFQITPATWRLNKGTDFAASPRLATPQQQAIVAARVFARDPGAWGFYRHPGRESPDELRAGLVPAGDPAPATPPPAPPAPAVSYGLPPGSNSGGYGGNGVRFPQWVYDLGDHFGLKPSTYRGHQGSDRIEAGYARNPQRLNRGIDWAAPGAPDEVDRMERFASYLLSIRTELEQVIWWNPRTNRRVGVAGGADVTNAPYYDYHGGYDDHRNHVHTRQSHPIPLPGGAIPAPPTTAPPALRPAFDEIEMFGKGGSKRSRLPVNFFIHTEEGNGTALSLAKYCQGQNGVSYHYTLRDRKVYCPVDTDLYSWSVLSANVFSINLCFAGARVAMSRQEWLAREGDIEIAAYLAVRDARKYGFSVEVLVPDWARSGADVYAGQPRAGISDHNYVTRELGIGDHTDVGRNFPWDRFVFYVNRFAGAPTAPQEGFLMALSDAEQRELLEGVRRITVEQTQKHPSRSALREPGEGLVDTWAGMSLNTDGNVDLLATFVRGITKYPPALERLKRVAGSAEPGRSPDDALLAQAMLATLQDVWSLLRAPVVTNTLVQNSAGDAQAAVELRALNARLVAQLAEAEEENRKLRQIAATPIPAAAPPVADISTLPDLTEKVVGPTPGPFDTVQEYAPSTGSRVADVVDSVEQWTQTSKRLDEDQRAALIATVEVLKGGTPPS